MDYKATSADGGAWKAPSQTGADDVGSPPAKRSDSMEARQSASWAAILLVVAFGIVATAVVPQAVPIIHDLVATFPTAGAYSGWLISLPSAICAVGALAAGLLVDRIGDRRMVIAGAICVALGDFGVYVSSSIEQLVGWRLTEGAGYLALAVGGATMLMRMTEGRRRNAALALWSAHTPIGFGLALVLITPLAGRGEVWRWSFAGHGLLVCALAVIGWLALHPRDLSGYRRGEGTGTVLRTPGAYRLGMASLSCALLTSGFMAALPGALVERFGMSLGQAVWVAVGDLTMNAAAALALAALMRRGLSMRGPALASSLVVALSWVGYFEAGTVFLAIMASGLFAIAIGAINALIWGMLPSVTPEPRASGATSGLVTQATYVGVLLGAPIVFACAHGHLVVLAFLIGPAFTVAMFLSLPAQRPIRTAPN